MTHEVQGVLQSSLADRYLIRRELGHGGMGIVYLADDLRLARPVAIKLMRPELAGSMSAERFDREILTVARLAHPGIVPVYDSGRVAGSVFFVMPFIDGPSLRDIIARERQLTIDRALHLVHDIAAALAFAHDHGVVHRDIKPANILLDGDRPLIADFGLALATAGSDDRLSLSFIVGTPEYMAPEQASPHSPIDGRADQYALACVLFEMLAGEPPVTGSAPHAILARKIAGEVHSLRVVRSTVPASVNAAIVRALQPVPADRFATIADFAEALRARTSGFWNRQRAAVATAVSVIALAGTTAMMTRGGDDTALIVVSPFANRTGNPRLDPIGPMVADWVAEGLHQVGRVVPTPTAQQAALHVNAASGGDRGDPLARLAEATGASIVVSGRYYLDRGRLAFRAQVSDVGPPPLFGRRTGGGVELRATTEEINTSLDSASAAFPAIRSRVMGLVAVGGEDDLTRRELEQQPPNYEAYLRFTEGMALYVAEDTMQAAEAFLAAYKQDSTFTTALLYAALNFSNARRYSIEDSLLRIVARSESRLSAYHRRWLEYRRAFLDGDRPRALRAIRALAADAPRSKAVYNLGIEAWENGHLEEAVRALETLDPTSGPIRGFQHYWGALAHIHHLLGNYREALAASRKARAIDPAGWRAVGWELGALIALGRTEEVAARAVELAHASMDDNNWSPAEALREAAEEARAHGHNALADSLWRSALTWYRAAERGPMLPRDRFGLAQTLYALGNHADAEVVARRLYEAFPSDLSALGLLGTIAARRGDSTRTYEITSMLAQTDPRYQGGRPTYQRALIAAASDQPERAIDLLRQARREGRSYQMWVHREIDFEALRSTPEYRGLLRAIPFSRAR